jgi:hypothetical protein
LNCETLSLDEAGSLLGVRPRRCPESPKLRLSLKQSSTADGAIVACVNKPWSSGCGLFASVGLGNNHARNILHHDDA